MGGWHLPHHEFLLCPAEREDLQLDLGWTGSQALESFDHLLRRVVIPDLRVGTSGLSGAFVS